MILDQKKLKILAINQIRIIFDLRVASGIMSVQSKQVTKTMWHENCTQSFNHHLINITAIKYKIDILGEV